MDLHLVCTIIVEHYRWIVFVVFFQLNLNCVHYMLYTLAGILVLNFPREFPDLISLGRSSVPLYVLLLLIIIVFVSISIKITVTISNLDQQNLQFQSISWNIFQYNLSLCTQRLEFWNLRNNPQSVGGSRHLCENIINSIINEVKEKSFLIFASSSRNWRRENNRALFLTCHSLPKIGNYFRFEHQVNFM